MCEARLPRITFISISLVVAAPLFACQPPSGASETRGPATAAPPTAAPAPSAPSPLPIVAATAPPWRAEAPRPIETAWMEVHRAESAPIPHDPVTLLGRKLDVPPVCVSSANDSRGLVQCHGTMLWWEITEPSGRAKAQEDYARQVDMSGGTNGKKVACSLEGVSTECLQYDDPHGTAWFVASAPVRGRAVAAMALVEHPGDLTAATFGILRLQP